MATSSISTYTQLLSPISMKSLSEEAKFVRKRHHKIEELSCLESRLNAASLRSRQHGFLQRAESYETQAQAVRFERERWQQLSLQSYTNNKSFRSIFHCFIQTFITFIITLLMFLFNSIIPIADFHPYHSLNHFNLLANWNTNNHPQHWATKIAQDELVKKGSRRADMYLRPVTT